MKNSTKYLFELECYEDVINASDDPKQYAPMPVGEIEVRILAETKEAAIRTAKQITGCEHCRVVGIQGDGVPWR